MQIGIFTPPNENSRSIRLQVWKGIKIRKTGLKSWKYFYHNNWKQKTIIGKRKQCVETENNVLQPEKKRASVFFTEIYVCRRKQEIFSNICQKKQLECMKYCLIFAKDISNLKKWNIFKKKFQLQFVRYFQCLPKTFPTWT